MCTRFVYRGDDTITGFNFEIDLAVWDHKIITEKDRFYIGILTARWGAAFLSWREPQRKCRNLVACSRKPGGGLSGFQKLHDNRRPGRTVCGGKNQF